MSRLLQLLRDHPRYRQLWLGQVASLMGDWLSYVAVALLAVQEGGGLFALAIVLVAHILPTAIMAPIAGVVADRTDRRRLLIGARLAEAVLTLGLLAAATQRNLLAVEALLVVRSAIGAMVPPAHASAIRTLLPVDALLDANALESATWSVVFAIGMVAGGVLGSQGPELALLADAGTFALSAALLWSLPSLPPAGSHRPGVRAAIGEMAQATRIIRADRDLTAAVVGKTPIAVASAGAWLLLNGVSDSLAFAGGAALTLGLLQSTRGIGTGVGPLIARRWLDRGSDPRAVRRVSDWTAFVGMGSFVLAAAVAPRLAPPIVVGLLIVSATIWGLGVGANWVITSAELQRRAPESAVGRVSALDWLLFTLGQSVAALTAGAISDGTGEMVAGSVVTVTAGIGIWVMLEVLNRGVSSDANAGLATS